MPDKTQNVSGEKAKRKRYLLVIFLILLAVICVYFLLRADTTQSPGHQLKMGSTMITLEYADTEAERVQGLSNRENLDKNTAMLFVFPKKDEVCMWMKDMNFSIDMVWLDQAKKVTKIEKDVSPETYPQAFCEDNTKYVLELNTGVSEQSHLQVGQRINF